MLRVGFVTCVRLGLSCMEAIHAVGGRLELAVSLHDHLAVRKAGRVYLDEFCGRERVPLLKCANINDAETVEAIRAARLDWLLVIGWSQIARRALLESTSRGALGIHPTLLPIGRGRAPIPWAIIHGLKATGVTLFKLDEGVDSGPIVAQRAIPLQPRETATTLYERVDTAHSEVLAEHWVALVSDQLTLAPQDHSLATYWPARTAEDGRLSEDMLVADADRLIRAVTRPYPGAFLDDRDRRLRVWASGAPCQDRGGTRPGEGIRLTFQDGWLEVTEGIFEPLSHAPD